jgi:hypothetical protein
VIEAPWLNAGHHAYAVYQRVHRHPVRLVSLNRLHADPRLALRNTLPRDPERWLAGDARLLIVHTDLGAEEARVESHLFGFRERLERLDTFWTALRRAGERLAADLRSEWGPPDVEEPGLLVWNLDRVRAARSHASG